MVWCVQGRALGALSSGSGPKLNGGRRTAKGLDANMRSRMFSFGWAARTDLCTPVFRRPLGGQCTEPGGVGCGGTPRGICAEWDVVNTGPGKADTWMAALGR